VEANTGIPVPAIPAAMLRRFTAAEGALYPLAITDPDRYRRAVIAVGVVFRQLRNDCASIDSLVQRLPSATEQVAQVAAAQDVSLVGLDPAAIADAAAALRYRELQSGPLTG
jgi:hypothetical protein